MAASTPRPATTGITTTIIEDGLPLLLVQRGEGARRAVEGRRHHLKSWRCRSSIREIAVLCSKRTNIPTAATWWLHIKSGNAKSCPHRSLDPIRTRDKHACGESRGGRAIAAAALPLPERRALRIILKCEAEGSKETAQRIVQLRGWEPSLVERIRQCVNTAKVRRKRKAKETERVERRV